MKIIVTIILFLIISLTLNANNLKEEFNYIKLIAVKEALVKKVVIPKPELTPEAKFYDEDNDGILNKNDECFNSPEGVQVDERGFELDSDDDSVGSPRYSVELSQNRANSVKIALTRHGVDSQRLTTDRKSFDEPVATNETTDDRALNRRIEVELLK